MRKDPLELSDEEKKAVDRAVYFFLKGFWQGMPNLNMRRGGDFDETTERFSKQEDRIFEYIGTRKPLFRLIMKTYWEAKREQDSKKRRRKAKGHPRGVIKELERLTNLTPHRINVNIATIYSLIYRECVMPYTIKASK